MKSLQLRTLAACVALAISGSAFAHGPQIQITKDNDKIVTRSLHLDGPYSDALSLPKSVYVMPILEYGDVWYTRPNPSLDPILGTPQFFSGPGLAYGYDQADGGPQAFAEGSVLSLQFTGGLKHWDDASFSDPGVVELKAFRGSDVNVASPPENFAVTSDVGPYDSVSLPPVEASYGVEGAEIHGTLRFALLGDGISPTSASDDGIYLLSMQLSSTQADLDPSDEYFFVLHKNSASGAVADAVAALGFDPALVQYVPEPASCALATIALVVFVAGRRNLLSRDC